MGDSYRTRLYTQLAESMAEPPEWLSLVGRCWPLFDTLAGLMADWEAAEPYLVRLANIPEEQPAQREERYAALFSTAKPMVYLYETAARTGKILGPQTFELARLYRKAGLELHSAELPDHISVELEFLAFLSRQEGGQQLERQFLAAHGAWMVDLGRYLARSGDGVYAVIGKLVADWLESVRSEAAARRSQPTGYGAFPIIHDPEPCTLCGFCVQACSTHALRILEDNDQTVLIFSAENCTHCGKCYQICSFKALKMEKYRVDPTRDYSLRSSPVVHCQKCARPIVSEAELAYITSQIGASPWQQLCMDCRAYY